MRIPTRLVRLTGAAALVLALSACQAPRPDVTFYGNRASVDSEYTLWCAPNEDRTEVQCDQPHGPDGEARLALGPGQGVQINVPDAIAEQPWLVTFVYRTSGGEELQGRSALLADHDLSYSLRTVESGDQLLRVEVATGFELGPQAAPTDAGGSGFDIGATRTWVLTVEPV